MIDALDICSLSHKFHNNRMIQVMMGKLEPHTLYQAYGKKIFRNTCLICLSQF